LGGADVVIQELEEKKAQLPGTERSGVTAAAAGAAGAAGRDGGHGVRTRPRPRGEGAISVVCSRRGPATRSRCVARQEALVCRRAWSEAEGSPGQEGCVRPRPPVGCCSAGARGSRCSACCSSTAEQRGVG